MQNNLMLSPLTQDVFWLLIKIISLILLCRKLCDLPKYEHIVSITLILTTTMPNRCYSPFYTEKPEKVQSSLEATRVNTSKVKIRA